MNDRQKLFRNRMEIGAVAAGFVMVFLMLSLTGYKYSAVEKTEKSVAETVLREFVEKTLQEGKITLESYDRMLNRLSVLSETYRVSMTVGRKLYVVPDERENETSGTEIPGLYDTDDIILTTSRENVYTGDIVDCLSQNGCFTLFEGDSFMVNLSVSENRFGIIQLLSGRKACEEEISCGCIIGR